MPSPDELCSFPWQALTWLIVNEGEMGDLLAAFGIQHDAGSDTEDVSLESLTERVSAGLQKLSSSSSFAPSVNIICTLGAQGIMYSVTAGQAGAEAKMGHLPAAKVINGVKDTTGAGDCFAGYFAAGLMKGEELETVLKTCLTVSSFTWLDSVCVALMNRHVPCVSKSQGRWVVCRPGVRWRHDLLSGSHRSLPWEVTSTAS
jgi:ribokinase